MTARKPDKWPPLRVTFSRQELQSMIFLYETGFYGGMGVPGVVERIVARWLESPEGVAAVERAMEGTS